MSDRADYIYPERVCFEIEESDFSYYFQAADYINRYGYDVLSVQHEYGIFGGDSGSHLMSLLREAKMPIVTTLHTVLRDPTESQRTVMDELLRLSERVVVMSHKAVGFLAEVHALDPEKVDVIPHGIPKIHESMGATLRSKLRIDGPMILTFGLLSPDKGIQYVIQAMPDILREHPGATYIVVGVTHPNVRSSSGEIYRHSLEAMVKELGLEDSVRFVDRFVSTEELVEYLAATDIYITPYLNPKQITSGTLAYALGSGKAVISTPYWYAEELLDKGRGVLVPFRDPKAIAEAVRSVREDDEFRQQMGRSAAKLGKQMLWPSVGKSYMESFARAIRDRAERSKTLERAPFRPATRATKLPDQKLDHLFDLSDDTGILQHATFTIPNRSEGYCVDDNARALLYTAYLESESPLTPDVALLQSRYLSFVLDALNPANGRFRNFMSYGRDWLEEAGSEDSHGRTLWSAGAVVHRCRDRGRREVAKFVFEKGATALYDTTSPRTWAYGVLAADEYLRAFPHEYSVQTLKQTLAHRIRQAFEYSQGEDWPWFERSLTYGNARLPQALVVAGGGFGERDLLDVGLKSLEWLMKLQTGAEGVFAPIGTNGFYVQNDERNFFDQQPIEAASSISACLSAYRVTGDQEWMEEAHRAFRWFLGENMLGQPVYDKSTGGCHDGLHVKRVNRNQGAESTLSFLCALSELRAFEQPRLSQTAILINHEVK